MKRSFSLPHALVLQSDGAVLLQEVTARTGSEAEAASILRGLARLGSDPSIWCYEITPVADPRTHRGSSAVAWTVRAVRH